MGVKEDIFGLLSKLHTAQEAWDVEGMMECYAVGTFIEEGRLRTALEGLVERDAFRERSIDTSECETFVHGDHALVKPVVYVTHRGPRLFSYHLARQDDGRWLILDVNRSRRRSDPAYTEDLVANAGKVVGSRGMLWIRRLEVPVERVWQAVSTKEGLDQWWLTRSVEIDLSVGGRFKHHWDNTVSAFEEGKFIDFAGVPPDTSGENLMRFELKPDGDGTLFSFFDGFNGAAYPLSLPWTCSGWHGTVDALEKHLTGIDRSTNFGLGGEFYWDHLRDHHRLASQAARLGPPKVPEDDWCAAYLAPAL